MGMFIRVLGSAVGCAAILGVCDTDAQVPGTAVCRALCFFQTLPAVGPADLFRAMRPPAITASEKSRVLARLPETGELQPNPVETANLKGLEAILIYHERQGVFDIKVIDVPQAFVGLHDRAVLLFSRPALRLLSLRELQAVTAHEIGHDYFWRDFEETVARGDKNGLRELELRCDATSVLTLIALGSEPLTLGDGLRKITRFNESIGATANADEYPPLFQRQLFIKAFGERYRQLQRPIASKR